MASTDVNTDVTTVTFGSGVNEFTLSLIGNEINKTNNITKWKSEIYVDNAVTSFEMENLNNFFIKGKSYNLSDVNNENCPLSINPDNTFSIHNGSVKKQFGKTVWVYSDNVGITHVVNDVSNIKRLVWTPYVSTKTFTDVDGNTVTVYNIQLENSQPYVKIRNIYDNGDIDTINLMPFVISENNEYISETIKESRYEIGLYNNKCYRYGTCKNKNVFPQNSGGESNYLPTFPENVNLPSGNNVKRNYISKDGNYLLNFEYNTLNYHGMTFKIYIASETELLRTLANFGLAFEYGGKRYYPVFENGVITGYTENINDTKDWYDWIGIKDHENADTPGSDGNKDDIDEIGINDFPFDNVGGLARYYAIDRFQLDELVSDFKKSEAGIPLDAGQFVIGLYQLPLDIPSICTTSQEKIVLGKLETNAVGKKLLTVNRKIHLGEYFISDNCGNNFLDYSPYTEIKLYIPFCGMVELPPNIFINSTVSVDMIVDIISGSCKGIVMCNNTFYTSINGSLMCSLPLSLEQCATKSLNVINSANSIMSGIIFGNKNYSALNTVTTLGEAMIENNNIAPSHISGNMDSVVNFYNPQICILFMSYPDVNMGDIGKTHGKVCNYQDTLNNCHGYTVVNNPHLEIKCTNTEKDEITKLLEQGVILP